MAGLIIFPPNFNNDNKTFQVNRFKENLLKNGNVPNIMCSMYALCVMRPNLKNLSRGLNLRRGSNMIGYTKNCIHCFKF